ncbi:PH domain-containing protein [Ditylenchus destructor]|nr:PH domain-containing protein [Ditylenchus destructor]
MSSLLNFHVYNFVVVWDCPRTGSKPRVVASNPELPDFIYNADFISQADVFTIPKTHYKCLSDAPKHPNKSQPTGIDDNLERGSHLSGINPEENYLRGRNFKSSDSKLISCKTTVQRLLLGCVSVTTTPNHFIIIPSSSLRGQLRQDSGRAIITLSGAVISPFLLRANRVRTPKVHPLFRRRQLATDTQSCPLRQFEKVLFTTEIPRTCVQRPFKVRAAFSRAFGNCQAATTGAFDLLSSIGGGGGSQTCAITAPSHHRNITATTTPRTNTTSSSTGSQSGRQRKASAGGFLGALAASFSGGGTSSSGSTASSNLSGAPNSQQGINQAVNSSGGLQSNPLGRGSPVGSFGSSDSASVRRMSTSSLKSQRPVRTPEDVIYEGWLMKRGEHIRNWRQRYFVLFKDGALLGFKAKPEAGNYQEPLNDFTVKDVQTLGHPASGPNKSATDSITKTTTSVSVAIGITKGPLGSAPAPLG